MCLQSISCKKSSSLIEVEREQYMHFGTAHSSIPVRKKIALSIAFPLPAFPHHQAFFFLPPYRCLSLRFSFSHNRKSNPFPMFLQPIAGIHSKVPELATFEGSRACRSSPEPVEEPSMRFRHRAQQYAGIPGIFILGGSGTPSYRCLSRPFPHSHPATQST